MMLKALYYSAFSSAVLLAYATPALSQYADKAEKKAAPGLPQLDPTWYASQSFWLLITFIILYALFSNRILPDLTRVIENRHEHIQNDLDTAEKLQKEAQGVHDEYDAVMAKARSEASHLYAEIDKDIKKKTEEEFSSLAARIIKDLQVAEKRITDTKKDVIVEIDKMETKIIGQVVGKVAQIKAKDSDIKKALKDVKKVA